jgi:hypothetical protein
MFILEIHGKNSKYSVKILVGLAKYALPSRLFSIGNIES